MSIIRTSILAGNAMELGAASSGEGANSDSLVAAQQTWSHPPNSTALDALVIQSHPSAMELLAAMERPFAMEPAAVRHGAGGRQPRELRRW